VSVDHRSTEKSSIYHVNRKERVTRRFSTEENEKATALFKEVDGLIVEIDTLCRAFARRQAPFKPYTCSRECLSSLKNASVFQGLIIVFEYARSS
jgi:hypothetical protein